MGLACPGNLFNTSLPVYRTRCGNKKNPQKPFGAGLESLVRCNIMVARTRFQPLAFKARPFVHTSGASFSFYRFLILDQAVCSITPLKKLGRRSFAVLNHLFKRRVVTLRQHCARLVRLVR